MRTIFLILVLVDLGYWAWQIWFVTPEVVPVQTKPVQSRQTGQSLQLYSELTASQRQALRRTSQDVSAETVAPNKPGGSTHATESVSVCASYGPFTSLDAIHTATRRLASLGFGVTRHVETGRIGTGYWVYLPPLPTLTAARSVVRRLKAKGFNDLYIVAEADERNAISLGVFSHHAGAQRRLATIQSLGYKPVLRRRFRDTPLYWLDVSGKPGVLPAVRRFSDLAEGDRKLVRRIHSCSTSKVATKRGNT